MCRIISRIDELGHSTVYNSYCSISHDYTAHYSSVKLFDEDKFIAFIKLFKSEFLLLTEYRDVSFITVYISSHIERLLYLKQSFIDG